MDIEEQKIYVELAKLSHEAFKDRRVYEWKVNLSLWMGLGLISYFALKGDLTLRVDPRISIGAGLVLWFAYFYFNVKLYNASWMDKEMKHYYMDKAEGKHTSKPALVIPKYEPNSGWHIPLNWIHAHRWLRPCGWLLGVLLFTALLTGVAGYSLSSDSNRKQEMQGKPHDHYWWYLSR